MNQNIPQPTQSSPTPQKIKDLEKSWIFGYGGSDHPQACIGHVLAPEGKTVDDVIFGSSTRFSEFVDAVQKAGGAAEAGELELLEQNMEIFSELGREWGLRGINGYREYLAEMALKAYRSKPGHEQSAARVFASKYGLHLDL